MNFRHSNHLKNIPDSHHELFISEGKKEYSLNSFKKEDIRLPRGSYDIQVVVGFCIFSSQRTG